MQDDNRIYLSDSLKDIIDLEDKPEVKELNKNFSNKVIKNFNQVYSEIKSVYSDNKIVGVLIKFIKKKNKIKYSFIINEVGMKQLVSSEIESISINNESNNIKFFSCEEYNIYYSIKKLSENIYILKTSIKEIKHEQ